MARGRADTPPCCSKGKTRAYENIRTRVIQGLNELKRVAEQEDERGTGEYPETERLLADLKTINEDYLALVLPRIEELLVPEEKRRTETITSFSKV
jgi:hypothetical protein